MRIPIQRKVLRVVNKPIEYLLNDPTTPSLAISILPPLPAALKYTVLQYAGGGYPKDSPQYHAALVYVSVTNTLNMVAQHTIKPMQRWAATSNLRVVPRAGVDLNAFYDRRSLQYFYYTNPKIGGTVYAADSSEIVAHECGHAILDAYRPGTWNSVSLEIFAFHEAFGDFIAMMNIMSYDEVLQAALTETGGDMSRSNVISRSAEQFGKALYALIGSQQDHYPDCLRNAVNNFKYIAPESLPQESADNAISAEPHSFSRIFSGALYDILVAMYQDKKAKGGSALDALKYAREALLRRMLLAIQNAPLKMKFYDSVARTLLWADVTQFNREYETLIRKALVNREIIADSIKMLAAERSDNPNRIETRGDMLHMRLNSGGIRPLSVGNPLYDVELGLPVQEAKLFDENGNLYDHLTTSQDDILTSAESAVQFLHKSKSVGDEAHHLFQIKNGKLVRKLFV